MLGVVERKDDIGLGHISEAESKNDTPLLDFVLIILRNLRLIGIAALAGAAIGLVIALSSPNEYTATAKVIRESENESTRLDGRLSALRSFGVDIGGTSTGLTTEAYPEIVKSREVRLAVVRDTLFFPEAARSMTFVEYANVPDGWLGPLVDRIKKLVIRAPSGVMAATNDEGRQQASGYPRDGDSFPTEEEQHAMEVVREMISTSVDPQTGIMALSTTASSPLLAATLTESYLDQLTVRVRTIRTEKAKQTLTFMKERFREAEEALMEAEEQLARFLDRNTNPQTAQLRTELERLQRNVTFKSQLYSDLQTQVTQAEIDLQRSQPVVTVLEKPIPPQSPSGPKRTLTVLLGLLVGSILGMSFAFVKTAVANRDDESRDQEKMEEIRAAFTLPRFMQRWRPSGGNGSRSA